MDKQIKLNNITKKLDRIRNGFKSVWTELAHVKITRDDLEMENAQLEKKLKEFESIEEIHIHIDLLKGSEHGAQILKKKIGLLIFLLSYNIFLKKAKLYQQLEFERSIYHEYSEEYFQMEHKILMKDKIQNQINLTKQSFDEQVIKRKKKLIAIF